MDSLTSNTNKEILAEFRETNDGADEDSDDEIEMQDDAPKRPAASAVIDALLMHLQYVCG